MSEQLDAAPTETPAAATPWWQRNLLALVLGAVVLVLAGVLLFILLPRGGPAEAPSKTVTIAFHLADFDTAYADCEGQGGYSDIGSGTPVTLKNASGHVLGAGTLGTGQSSSNGTQAAFCDWTVELRGVPADEDFYAAEVGSRGAVTLSREDLAADDWKFAVSLGS